MNKLLILSVLILIGCTRRDLPVPEKKKVVLPVAEVPKNEEPKSTGKKQPDDPNRKEQAKVQAAPEIIKDEPQKPSGQPTAPAPGNPPSGGTGGSSAGGQGGGQSTAEAEKREPILRWNELITDLKLSDENQVKTRTESVKSMLGEKAEEKIAAWKNDGLFKAYLAYSLTVEPKEKGKFKVVYNTFLPWKKQKETDHSVVAFPFVKEVSSEELDAGVELPFGSDNQELTAAIHKSYGKVKIQRLKGIGSDYLVTQKREDGKAMAAIFHSDKIFGNTAPLVLIFGLESNPELVLKEFNLVNFVDIGQEKLKGHILPLKSAIEKLPETITKNPELMKLKFDVFGTELNKFAIQTAEGKPGYLNLLLEKMKKPSLEILAARFDEILAAGKMVPLETSASLDSISRVTILDRFNKLKIEFEKALEYLKRADAEDPKRNLKEIMDLVSSVKFDLEDISLASLLLWKEEPFILQSVQRPAEPPAPEKK